jgi:hypothetical protein
MIDVFHAFAIKAAKFYFSTENFAIHQKKAMFVFLERIWNFLTGSQTVLFLQTFTFSAKQHRFAPLKCKNTRKEPPAHPRQQLAGTL